ncbi:MAG: Wzz/FepE/Etk N-terminal domain-containing protein [Candidatus Aureabacteria bacterium]|nr:Wzz/FepE/Etk N-terminal domain-containing protein [Candidatus Auribacterota bacterium]
MEHLTMSLRSTARSYLEIIFHRKWLLIIPIIFGTLIAWGYSYTTTPMYKSTAVVEVTEKSKENPYIKGFSQSTPISGRMGEILQRVRSRSMIEDIVKELNLHENTRNELEYRNLIEQVRDGVAVTASSSSLLQISCSFTNAVDCQKIVNLLTRRIIKENLELQEKETEVGIEWLNKEMEINKKRIEEADDGLQKFQEQYADLLPEELSNRLYSSLGWQDPFTSSTVNPPFSPEYLRPLGATQNIYSLRYQNYSDDLLKQALRLKQLQTKRATLLKQLEGEDEFILSERVSETNPIIQSLRNELVGKQVQLTRLRLDSTEEHPLVKQLSREIENLQESLKNAATQSIKQETTALNPLYQAIKMQLAETEREIAELEESIELIKTFAQAAFQRMEQIPGKKKELDSLRRESANAASAYANLLQKRETAYVTRRLELEERGTKFRIVDNAEIPLQPFKPKRSLIVIGGFFFGLVIGGGLVVLAETTDHSFEEPNQLREFLPIPLLGATSQILTPEEKAFSNSKKRLAVLAILVFAAVTVLAIIVAVIFQTKG